MRSTLLPQLNAGIRMLAVMTVALGLGYPLLMTGFAQLAFPGRADGQILEIDGAPVGSKLIGQEFTEPGYFHGRPSAVGYDASTSSGSNLGPTHPEYLAVVADLVAAYRAENGLADGSPVPVDAVTASASGLDPHISPANAGLQAARVAAARGLSVDDVRALIEEHTEHRALGFLGDDAVNVLELNIALDRLAAGGS
jgi:K+-transporting ATPase ATPase C chain